LLVQRTAAAVPNRRRSPRPRAIAVGVSSVAAVVAGSVAIAGSIVFAAAPTAAATYGVSCRDFTVHIFGIFR